MSDFEDLIAVVAALRRDHEKLSNDYHNTFSQGAVTDSDHDKGVRIGLDKDGEHKSAWAQPADSTGRSRNLPRKDDQVLLIRPHGDGRQAIAIGLGHSDAKKNPAKDAKNTVLHDLDNVRIEADGDGGATITAKTITFKCGGVTVVITDSGVKVSGGKVTHDDKDIGKTHKHGGVQTGGGDTDVPKAG